MKYRFVFDVEAVGLHGEPFAVGFVVEDEADKEVDSGVFACPREVARGSDDDREWIDENVPVIQWTHGSIEGMLDAFWVRWMEWKEKGALIYVECGWPVEAKFLAMCIGRNYPASKWDGPYPLHEIASFMEAAGMDAMATYERLPAELPAHHPLSDSRLSARLLRLALSSIKTNSLP